MTPATTTDPRPADAPPRETPADPHDLLTPEQRARFEAYMAGPKPEPWIGTDENGRRLPINEEEARARWEEGLKRLAEINAEDDDPPGLWERFAREINEERALEGRGPAFSEKDLCGGS
jgi:hypothetical protein